MPDFAYSAEPTLTVSASDDVVFGCLDDHRNLSAHVEQPSEAMLSSRMEVHTDTHGTRSVGSTFGFAGSFLGIPSIGAPTLRVVERHRMDFKTVPRSMSSLLAVFIGYDLPQGFGSRTLGWPVGGHFARWCARRMAGDAVRHLRTHTTAEPPMRGGTPRGEQE